MSPSIDWSSLPPELLQAIAKDLPTIDDYICFRAVCRSWCASAQMKCCFLPREFLCIVVPTDTELSSPRRLLFNPLTKKSFYGICVPEFSKIPFCIGSSFGRLILADGSPDGIIVFNPLNGEKTHLPSLVSVPEVINFDSSRSGKEYTIQFPKPTKPIVVSIRFLRNSIRKVILAHDCEDNHPNSNKPFAFLLWCHGFDITYCNHGDVSWKSIHGTGVYNQDAAYLKGKLYLLDYYGSLAICNLNNVPPTVDFMENLGPDSNNKCQQQQNYLVDDMGELLWVKRYFDYVDMSIANGLKTLKFDVLKFDWSIKKWKHIKSLGNKVLIVGRYSSMALAASDYPGCRGNTIYYTGDTNDFSDFSPEQIVSMYDMCNESIEVLASYPEPKNPTELVWVTRVHV